MAWFILVVAGLAEVVWAALLPHTEGFSRPLPSIGFLVALVASMVLLERATRTIPLGTGYAVWVGIGVIGAATAGVVIQGEHLSPARAGFLALLVVAIAGLKLTTTTAA